MGEDFLKEHGEVVKQVKADPGSVNLRAFIQDEIDGCLFSVLFNQQGRAFAGYYYGEESEHLGERGLRSESGQGLPG